MSKPINKSVRIAQHKIKFFNRYKQTFSAQFREDSDLLEMLLNIGTSEIAHRFTLPEACVFISTIRTNTACSLKFKSMTFPIRPTIVLRSLTERVFRQAYLNPNQDIDYTAFCDKLNDLSELGALAVMHFARLIRANLGQEDTESIQQTIHKLWPGLA